MTVGLPVPQHPVILILSLLSDESCADALAVEAAVGIPVGDCQCQATWSVRAGK